MNRNILSHTDSSPHSVGEEQDYSAGVMNSKCIRTVIMHKPYGHLKVQERRPQSRNVPSSCRNWLMMLLSAVCCTGMLNGQAVQASLFIMGEQMRCWAGMMLDVQTPFPTPTLMLADMFPMLKHVNLNRRI